jgi:hypothetical protein
MTDPVGIMDIVGDIQAFATGITLAAWIVLIGSDFNQTIIFNLKHQAAVLCTKTTGSHFF